MHNPISKNKNYLLAFLILWVVIVGIHTAVISFLYDISWQISLTDAVVFNTILAIVGYNLWYLIRFNLREKKAAFDLIINHLTAAVIIIASWMVISYFIMKSLYGGDESYMPFLNDSLWWRVITGIFFYLFFVLFYYVIIYYEDLQEKLNIESEMQNLVKEAELNALKSQINPHFLFNSLNSISSLTITNPEAAQEMVIKLSDFLRYSLSHDKDEKASLREELENLSRYLDIEKIRFGKRLNFRSDISDGCYDLMIPNMILQPLIENSIKHGVYNSTEEVLVELKCTSDDYYFTVEISNDYDPEAVKKKGEGIGLRNIKKRLQLIYKRQDLFKTTADGKVFKAILKLPKN